MSDGSVVKPSDLQPNLQLSLNCKDFIGPTHCFEMQQPTCNKRILARDLLGHCSSTFINKFKFRRNFFKLEIILSFNNKIDLTLNLI